ncbi:T9SS type A sorting domain-containing protein [Sungkyunkwania multivorans]|uniref:T9SS type A sorting domain-containing protein n=1 Tax=Sungkyunkwania multivorans TaxID=1173618 RepID=A0ABW3CYE1_9FLAO
MNDESSMVTIEPLPRGNKKKTMEERARFHDERVKYEYKLQADPRTGEIPKEEKLLEKAEAERSIRIRSTLRAPEAAVISRGPGNLGGRTRTFVIDRSDNTNQTMIAGGVSSGVFRTTNGGASWTKVSPNDQIHNVTSIVQDPRSGFENVWYYATGETLGNSASGSGAFYLGQGIWQSTDGGLNWSQLPSTASVQTAFDSLFDVITKIEVSPTTGELFAACVGAIQRFDGVSWTVEQANSSFSTAFVTDLVIANNGRVYAAFSGNTDDDINGVWTSATGNNTTGSWTRIAQNAITSPATPENPTGWAADRRIVLGLAPSNQNILYALFTNGNSGAIEADLWQWNQGTSTWTDYSAKLPDEGTTDLAGNDPFAVQGGYDLVVSVKPDDQNFVVIGGTNAYKIADITTDPEFIRIGGYVSELSYGLYNAGGVNHHPDIHAMVFDPTNTSILYTGTDGGIHRTDNVGAATVTWVNLNNDYQTYQYYDVGIDPLVGSNGTIGGAQDNGTTIGGTIGGNGDDTTQLFFSGGDGVSADISRDGGALIVFFGSQQGNIRRLNATVGGGSVNIKPSGSPSGNAALFVTLWHLDQDNNNALYYAGNSTLYRTTDATNVTTATWTNMSNFGADNISAFATTRGAYNAASSYLLAGTRGFIDQTTPANSRPGQIYRLDDPQNAANTGPAIDITPSAATPGATVSGLAVHPTNNDIVLAVYSNYGAINIFLTTNATSATPTWTNVERNLTSFSVRSAMITEVGGNPLYFVGTGRGLYSTLNPLTTDWAIEGQNLVGQAVVSSMSYRPADNKLLVGTHGNGMFEVTVSDPTLGVEDNEKVAVSAYPNPATDLLKFELDAETMSSIEDYKVYDLSGKVVSFGELSTNGINVGNLSPGLYIAQLNGEGKTFTSKFVKK